MKFRIVPIFASAALLGSVAAAPSMAAQVAEDNPSVNFTKITINGTGCKGVDAPTYQTDGQVLVVNHRSGDMLAGAGAPVSGREFRKNCQIAVLPEVPEGYRVGVKRMLLTGSAYIENGARGLIKYGMYVQGSSTTARGEHELKGKHTGKFFALFAPEEKDIVWSPCGTKRFYNINTEFRVYKGSQTADSYSWIRGDESPGMIAEFVTKKC